MLLLEIAKRKSRGDGIWFLDQNVRCPGKRFGGFATEGCRETRWILFGLKPSGVPNLALNCVQSAGKLA